MEKDNNIADEDEKLVNEADDDAEGGDDASAEDTTDDSAGGDDASDAGGDGSSSEESEGSGEENDANAEEEAKDEPENDEFSGLSLIKANCFGYTYPVKSSWVNLAQAADDKGWNNIDQEKLESSLMHNVEKCYYNIASFVLANANDDMQYKFWFDNNKTMWKVQILDSPNAEMTIEQRAAFFKSYIVKKIAKQTWHWLLDAKKIYYKTLSKRLEDGELLSVDVVKLGAIMHFLDLNHFLDNIRDLKYINY